MRRLDGHCRSHNIAAECCVSSSGPATGESIITCCSDIGVDGEDSVFMTESSGVAPGVLHASEVLGSRVKDEDAGVFIEQASVSSLMKL